MADKELQERANSKVPVGLSKETKSYQWPSKFDAEEYLCGFTALAILCPWILLGMNASLLQQEESMVQEDDKSSEGGWCTDCSSVLPAGPRGMRTCFLSCLLSIFCCGCGFYFPLSGILSYHQRKQIIAKYSIPEEESLCRDCSTAIFYHSKLVQQSVFLKKVIQTHAPSVQGFVLYEDNEGPGKSMREQTEQTEASAYYTVDSEIKTPVSLSNLAIDELETSEARVTQLEAVIQSPVSVNNSQQWSRIGSPLKPTFSDF